MKDSNLLISACGGYLLKLAKNGYDMSNFKNEFDALRHGNYDKFFDLMKVPEAFMLEMGDNGIIRTTGFSQKNGDGDFVMIIKIAPGIKTLYQKFHSMYGDVHDVDISDETYRLSFVFETSLRMHAKIDSWTKLVDIIDEISKLNNLSSTDTMKLHDGRKFLNKIKHENKRKKYDYNKGSNNIRDAYSVLYNNKLIITNEM